MVLPLSASPASPVSPHRPVSWRERWLLLRNRWIGSAQFQRWAAQFPLTRPIARRQARALFDLVAGFVYSQTLAACVRLQLFDLLSAGPLAPDEVAARIHLKPEAATRLLKAAASLQLVEALPDGRYGLGALGAALSANPSLSAMIEHHTMLYADLSDPVALLQGRLESPKLKSFWAYAKNPDAAGSAPEEVRAYSLLMAQSQAMIAHQVLDAYDLGCHRRLLDIGGGEGAFLLEAGLRHPRLGLALFDLPAVAARAGRRLEAAGLGDRATAFGGDFFRDALPGGADIVSLVRVLHDHDDECAMALLCQAHAALPKNGVLLLAEPMAGTPGAEPAGDAYFGFYLAAMGSGRPRTAAEIAQMVHRAGFQTVRECRTAMPMMARVLVAVA